MCACVCMLYLTVLLGSVHAPCLVLINHFSLRFSLQHALDCKLGGLRTIQHNEARDTMAQFMREAGFSPVETEPALQPLSGEEFFY